MPIRRSWPAYPEHQERYDLHRPRHARSQEHGLDVRQTVALMKKAKEITKQFDKSASAIMTNWDIRCMEWVDYTPRLVSRPIRQIMP